MHNPADPQLLYRVVSGLVSEIFSSKFATRITVLRGDVINDVISSGSTIREDHVDIPYSGTLC